MWYISPRCLIYQLIDIHRVEPYCAIGSICSCAINELSNVRKQDSRRGEPAKLAELISRAVPRRERANHINYDVVGLDMRVWHNP